MLDQSWLDHSLTSDEASEFEENGFIVVPDALDEARHEELLQAVERSRGLLERERGVAREDRMLLLDILGLEPAFYELVDAETTFPKVCGILGWNIFVYHTNLDVAPSLPGTEAVYRQHYLHTHNRRLSKSFPPQPAAAAWQWHRDSGQVNDDLGPLPHPRISVKVAYFLTDALASDDGNLFVVPGSHRDTAPRDPPRGDGLVDGAVGLRVPARSAVVFDRRILHSSSPNTGGHTRKVLFYGYAYRWFRPRDDMTVGHLLETASPIRRQLLGAGLGNYGYSSPVPEEVPLRAWLDRHARTMAEAGVR